MIAGWLNPSEGTLGLFGRLKKRNKVIWSMDYATSDRREDTTVLADAQVVCSTIAGSEEITRRMGTPATYGYDARHVVALDIDYPAHLIPSSTPGHFHLYLEVPGGIPHADYMELLDHLAAYRVIERGFQEASEARGSSQLRLPWVLKERAKPVTVTPPKPPIDTDALVF